MSPHDDHDPRAVHEHDLGLQHDLGTLQRRRLGRRGLLSVLGGVGVVAFAGCAESRLDQSSGSGTASSGAEATPMAGAALYAWHCDRDGAYSMYDGDAAAENYLRGVQAADEDGWLEFTTIFPGCYPGRWPHVHFEVYESVDTATSAATKLRTSQLAFPADVCEQVYATEGYEQSATNLAGVSLERDGIFSDGYSLQLARMSGSASDGLVATLNVPV